jgi:hypothetical protein
VGQVTVEHYISSILYIRDNRKVANFASVYFGKRVTVDLVAKVRKQKTLQPMKQYKAIDDKAATNWAMAARQANREFRAAVAR